MSNPRADEVVGVSIEEFQFGANKNPNLRIL